MKRWLIALMVVLGMTVANAQQVREFTLKQCIEFGLKNNPNMQIARMRYQVAKNNKASAFGNFMPTISGSIGYSKSESGPSSFIAGEYVGPNNPFTNRIRKFDNYSQRLNLNLNLFDFGVNYYNLKSSLAQQKAEEFNVISSEQQVILNIIEKYFNVIQQEKILEVRQKAVERSEEQVRRAEAMYNVGSAAKIDVYRARVNLGNDQMALLSQQDELENARQQLSLALGLPPTEKVIIKDELKPILDLGELEKKSEKLEETNPQLVNLKYSTLSSRYRKFVSLGQMLPTFSFFAGYSRSVPQYDFWFKEFDREYTWFYGVTLSFNLFNGFRDRKNYENSVINYRIAHENYRLQKMQQENQFLYLINRFQTLKKIREANLLNLETAQEEYNLAEERYRVGSGTSLEVRDAQVRLTQAEQLLIQADYNLLIAYYQIKALLGELE